VVERQLYYVQYSVAWDPPTTGIEGKGFERRERMMKAFFDVLNSLLELSTVFFFRTITNQ
jgi:hypothetical protein